IVFKVRVPRERLESNARGSAEVGVEDDAGGVDDAFEGWPREIVNGGTHTIGGSVGIDFDTGDESGADSGKGTAGVSETRRVRGASMPVRLSTISSTDGRSLSLGIEF